MPTETLAISSSPSAAKILTVFSPRFAVKRRPRSSDTRTPATPFQSGNGPTEAIGSGVHDLDTIVRRMGDVEPGGGVMDRSVIETAFLRMRGKLDEAQEPEAHRGACSNLAFPSTLSLQYA